MIVQPFLKCTPVLLIYFNRPNVLLEGLRALKKIKPEHVFLAHDGARKNLNDLDLIEKCEAILVNEIDWGCQIERYSSDTNNGCDQFVPMAINWFFSKVEAGIILEDDCIISDDFYEFSTYLLEKFKNNDRIMNISASNFHEQKWGDGDYYFSQYPANWAWATWRRAWQHYDPKMQKLDIFIGSDGLFNRMKLEREERRYWLKFFRGLQKGKYTFWDAKWLYAIWGRDGISITPNFNLSTNIGFGDAATHTKERTQTHALPIQSLGRIPIDPSSMDIQRSADHYLYLNFYRRSLNNYLKVAFNKMKTIFL